MESKLLKGGAASPWRPWFARAIRSATQARSESEPQHNLRCGGTLLLGLAALCVSPLPILAANASDLDPAFELVARAVANGDVPGAVALVAHDGKVIREAA